MNLYFFIKNFKYRQDFWSPFEQVYPYNMNMIINKGDRISKLNVSNDKNHILYDRMNKFNGINIWYDIEEGNNTQ